MIWEIVGNVLDFGVGNLVYFDFGFLILGYEYVFCLESCNRINCLFFFIDILVIIKGI